MGYNTPVVPSPRPSRESTPTEPPFEAAAARRALSVFFLSGMLMAFPGAILPAWGYHLSSNYDRVGHYFLAICLGILISVKAAPWLLARKNIRFVLILGCALASASFVYLALVLPPASSWWRFGGMILVGLSSGLLTSAAFHIVAPAYHHDPAATVNLAGAMFGLGCLVMALLVAGAYYVYTVASILILTALIPGFLTGIYARSRFPAAAPEPEPSWHKLWDDSRSLGAVLLTLLLFFQFGNEWSLAGWLTLFLIQRIGVSPETSLKLLAFYWLALLVGRFAAQWLLPRVSHGRLLIGSATAAMVGCLILISTNNRFGAGAGILFVGWGFSVIYPLVVEKIGHRFPYYRPGFFNGIFSFGMTAGFLAPWTLGFLADAWGIQAVMALPMAGTVMVFLLLVLLWLETRLTSAQ